MPERAAALEAAYRATTYVVDHPDGEIGIRIGEHHPRLDALLAAHGATEWAYITAWNPGSVKKSFKNNKLQNNRLRAAVRAAGHVCYPGRGRPDGGAWTPEESLLVVGIAEAQAVALGARFGQNAVVTGVAGGPARLRWCAVRAP